MSKFFASMAAIGALAIASPAAAATVMFDAGGTGNSDGSRTFTDGSTTIRVAAFSVNSSGQIVRGTLQQWSGNGLGIQNSSDDDSHTVDNSGWKDFLIFSFNTTVRIDNATFTTNYNYNNGSCCLNDTDATIGAGTYNQAWINALVGQNQSALDVLGLLQSTGAATRDITPTNRSGTLWLIGASFTNTDAVDGFKFKAIDYKVTPPPVPEPSTWALLILGFGGVGAAMRKRKQQALAFA